LQKKLKFSSFKVIPSGVPVHQNTPGEGAASRLIADLLKMHGKVEATLAHNAQTKKLSLIKHGHKER
jgi:hypothetical protein